MGSGEWLVSMLIRLAINAIGLLAAASLIDGIHLRGLWTTVLVAAIFGLVNALIRPFVLMVTCLLQVLTLGLFTLIVNTAMLGLTAWLAGQFELDFRIDDFLSAFLGAIVISIVSFLLTRFMPAPN